FASTEPLAPGGATPACRGGSDPTYSGGGESLEQRGQIHRAGRSNRTESAWRAIPGDTPCQGFRHGHSAGYAGKHFRAIHATEVFARSRAGWFGDWSGLGASSGGSARWHDRGPQRWGGPRQRVRGPPAP